MISTSFWENESAATTVEWVVLTSAIIVALGAVVFIISDGTFRSSEDITTDTEIGKIVSDGTMIEDLTQSTLTAEDLQFTPTEPELFENWGGANKWINACMKTGGVPEVSADSTVNYDGSPSKIICNK